MADALRADIISGELGPGDQLPSYDDLRRGHGVSITVVRSAVRELRTEGLVTTHQGKGAFVADPLPPTLANPDGSDTGDVQALHRQVAALAAEIRTLKTQTPPARALAEDIADLRRELGHLQAQVIDLYGRTGLPYPHTGANKDRPPDPRRTAEG
jgi:DNA-binding FadR family transcriptional regulator